MEMFPLSKFLQMNLHLHNKQMSKLRFLIYTRIHYLQRKWNKKNGLSIVTGLESNIIQYKAQEIKCAKSDMVFK